MSRSGHVLHQHSRSGAHHGADALGAKCRRVDEQIYQGTVLQQIYNQIARADLVVADLSGNNPNVCYETGYAHAMGKKTVLLIQKARDIPFNLRHYPHIIYGNDVFALRNRLEEWGRYYLGISNDVFRASGYPIKLVLNDIDLTSTPTRGVNVTIKMEGRRVCCHLKVQNQGDKPLPRGTFKFAIVTSPMFARTKGPGISKSLPIPDDLVQHGLAEFETILPGEWMDQEFELIAQDATPSPRDRNLTLRVLTASGPQDYPIKLRQEPGS